MMANGDPEGRIFLFYPPTNNGFFFLLTTDFFLFKKSFQKSTLVNVYVDLLVFTRIAGTS